MNDNAKKRIEIAADISIILVALLMCVTFIPRLWYLRTAQPTAQPRDILVPGVQIPLPKYDWAGTDRNLLLVLSEGCQFCSQSAGFYQQLTAEIGNNRGVKLIAIFPQDVNSAKQYHRQLGLSLDTVMQVPLSTLGVAGTPTLILADNKGFVKKLWTGRLSAQGEADVLKELR